MIMDRSLYIYGYSRYSRHLYPNNRATDFVIPLPQPIHLEGEWECGLVQFHCESSADAGYYVCCDLVSESYVGNFKLPVLRRVRQKLWQYRNILYVPLKTRDCNSIRLYMRTWRNREPTGVKGSVYCLLHLKRVA